MTGPGTGVIDGGMSTRRTLPPSTSPSRTTAFSRRAFLRAVGAISAILGTSTVVACAPAKDTAKGDSGAGDTGTNSGDSGCTDPTALPLNAGNVSSLAVGDLQGVSGSPVCIGRDSGGVYAMTTLCTHEQCDMQTDGRINSKGLYCACHGSKFDVNGAVTKGPATKALAHYEVAVACDGTITVDKSSKVDASTRAAVG